MWLRLTETKKKEKETTGRKILLKKQRPKKEWLNKLLQKVEISSLSHNRIRETIINITIKIITVITNLLTISTNMLDNLNMLDTMAILYLNQKVKNNLWLRLINGNRRDHMHIHMRMHINTITVKIYTKSIQEMHMIKIIKLSANMMILQILMEAKVLTKEELRLLLMILETIALTLSK